MDEHGADKFGMPAGSSPGFSHVGVQSQAQHTEKPGPLRVGTRKVRVVAGGRKEKDTSCG